MSGRQAISRRRIEKLRGLIAAAERDGSKPASLLLRLSLGDASELKRDKSVAVHEISFKEGEMRFLGIKVIEGGVSESRLDTATA